MKVKPTWFLGRCGWPVVRIVHKLPEVVDPDPLALRGRKVTGKDNFQKHLTKQAPENNSFKD